MKVLLISNYESDEQNSMQRFATSLAHGLAEAGHRVRVLKPHAVVGRLYRSWRGFGKWLGYVDKFGIFPPVLKAAIKWADVTHICDHANSFYTKHMRASPHVVTCHDLLAIRSALGEIPQNRTRWTGRQLQRLILRGLTEAQHVVCISEATRRDLLRIAGIPTDRVSRIYNSFNYSYSPMEQHEAVARIRKLHVDPSRPFLLHVGANQWYKNRLGVLRIFFAFRKLTVEQDLKLVMVGKPWTAEMRRFVAENQLADVTLELTGVAGEDLRALYSTALMLLFPSLQEGFGWPIIEAQACGCPVLTSNRAPMDEVGGSGAIYIDPENPELAAATIKCSLMKLSGLRELGLQNAARFSQPAMIDAYVFLYERAQRQLCASTARLMEPVR
jgi:glycosyltransferase involved in cell wall biosynthesis